ncbi:MAG: zinc metalloprotease HtpX [Actinomycetes bacterium]
MAARGRFAPDRGLSARMGGTMFLLGLLYVVVFLLLISFLRMSAGFAIAISAGMLFFQWYASDSIAMFGMRAVEVTPEQAPQLHAVVDRLCALADVPKPRVAISETDLPNAFATGRSPNRSVVCVTTGLLKRLDESELEGVLAHELSHVAHRDVLVMTIASFAAVLAGVLSRMALWGGLGFGGGRGGNNDEEGGGAAWLVVIVVGVVVYFVAFLLMRGLSRYRELSADRSGALLTGRPSALASALQKITGDMGRIPTRDLRQAEAFNAFFFAPAIAPGASLSSLFATHPPLQTRLDQLARIAAQLGQ